MTKLDNALDVAAMQMRGNPAELAAYRQQQIQKQEMELKKVETHLNTIRQQQQQQFEAQRAFWQTIQSSTNPKDFDAYLSRYPNGEFATLARNRLEVLKVAPSLPPAPVIAIAPTPAPVPARAAASRFPETPIALTYSKVSPRPDDIAVIIGNANYGKSAKDIPDVVPAYADAEGFKRYAMEALGVREGNVIFIKDATQAQLISVFGSETTHRGQLFNWVQPGSSNVFVFYAGHGAPGGADGQSYLVPADANASTIALNGYPVQTLYRNLGKVPAKSITLVLESCFSGVSQAGAVVSQASPVYLQAKAPDVPPNVTMISAGAANQIASWEQDSSHGLFTKYFLKGMSGEADQRPHGNGDGRVAWEELGAYLKATLTYYARRYYGRDQTAQIVVGKGD